MTQAEVMEALRQFCNKKLKKKMPQSIYDFEVQRDGGCMAGYDEISGHQFRFTITDYSE